MTRRSSMQVIVDRLGTWALRVTKGLTAHGRWLRTAGPSKLFARPCNKFRAQPPTARGPQQKLQAKTDSSPYASSAKAIISGALLLPEHRLAPPARAGLRPPRTGETVAPGGLAAYMAASAWRDSSSKFWPCCGNRLMPPLSPSDRSGPAAHTPGCTHAMILRATWQACSAVSMAWQQHHELVAPLAAHRVGLRARRLQARATAPAAGRPCRGPACR
jgi:hypothetical protein